MRVKLELATVEQAPEISALRQTVADRLTARFGRGPWSRSSSVKGVLYDLRNSTVYVVRKRNRIIATLALGTKKPWAISPKSFTKCRRPLYLISMAVLPTWQGKGVGRACLDAVQKIAKSWPADSLRLDAYDAAAGAGGFYGRGGFREVGRATYRTVPLIYFERML